MILREASVALGINEGMLWRWRKEYKEVKFESFSRNGRMSGKDAEIARLRQENRRLLAEREILKKQRCVVRSTNVRRYQFILEHQRVWPTRWMCSALNVSASGYYRWKSRKPSRSSLRRHIQFFLTITLLTYCGQNRVQFTKLFGQWIPLTRHAPFL